MTVFQSGTCIVGIGNGKDVWLGGDSCVSIPTMREVTTESKIMQVNDMLLGYCGSIRMAQILQYHTNLPKRRRSQTDYEYLVQHFVKHIRDIFVDAGFATVRNNQEQGGQFIVGYRGNIYEVSEDYSVVSFQRNWVAIGCGADWATGSLHTTQPLRWKPERRIKAALEAASEFSPFVGPPFTIARLGGK